jgi:hypothetical protein
LIAIGSQCAVVGQRDSGNGRNGGIDRRQHRRQTARVTPRRDSRDLSALRRALD